MADRAMQEVHQRWVEVAIQALRVRPIAGNAFVLVDVFVAAVAGIERRQRASHDAVQRDEGDSGDQGCWHEHGQRSFRIDLEQQRSEHNDEQRGGEFERECCRREEAHQREVAFLTHAIGDDAQQRIQRQHNANRGGRMIVERRRERTKQRRPTRHDQYEQLAEVTARVTLHQHRDDDQRQDLRQPVDDQQDQTRDLRRVVGQVPAGEPFDTPVNSGDQRALQRRLRRIEVPLVSHFVDRAPTGSGVDLVDLKRAPFDQRPDGLPARTIIRRLQRRGLHDLSE